MTNPDKNLKSQISTREDLCQACGLKLADEIADALLEGNNLSLEDLTRDHTFTEIGTALIRLDALSFNNADASTEAACKRYITVLGLKVCVEHWQRDEDW